MVALSKAWGYGCWLAGIAGSNRAGSMDVCLVNVLFCRMEVCVGLIIRPEDSYQVCYV